MRGFLPVLHVTVDACQVAFRGRHWTRFRPRYYASAPRCTSLYILILYDNDFPVEKPTWHGKCHTKVGRSETTSQRREGAPSPL